MIKNVIFDLDGTLIDTIEDISIAINEALEEVGLSQRFDRVSTCSLIGNGADVLIRKALLDKGDDQVLFDRLKNAYMPRYKAYQNNHSVAFDGVDILLKDMRKEGMHAFVFTNKPDELARIILSNTFGNAFEDILGQRGKEHLKPDPHFVLAMMEKHGMKKSDTIYVGDSIVDILTAHNAGLPVILVKWGYGTYDKETLALADFSVDCPEEIMGILQGY